MIDWLTVFLLMAPVQLSMQSFGQFFDQHDVLGFLWKLVDFVPIVTFTVLLLFWRQSIGRELMQLRVVNRHGIKASGRLLAFRSGLRMIIPWLSCVLFVLGFHFANAGPMSMVVIGIGLACWLTDLGFMIFSPSGRSLHDRIFKTRVVLDTH